VADIPNRAAVLRVVRVVLAELPDEWKRLPFDEQSGTATLIARGLILTRGLWGAKSTVPRATPTCSPMAVNDSPAR